jgi:hypothetical protein
MLRLARLAVPLLLAPASCRYLAPATPLRGVDGPALEANHAPGDPTRAQPIPARRCVLECGPAYVCDEALAECVPVRSGSGRPDAGPAWLP